jgi:hypothetical protein
MTSAGPERDELLSPQRPLLPRRVRQAAVALLALGVAVGIAVAVWPDQHRTPPVAAFTSSAASSPTPVRTSAPPTLAGAPWPTAPSGCGSRTDLPIVTGAVPATGHTGIAVVLGGTRVATLDFDTGRIERPAGVSLPRGEYVTDIVGGRSLRLATFNCRGLNPGGPRLYTIGKGGAVAVRVRRPIDQFLVDGTQVWGLRWPADVAGRGALVPIGGGAPVTLPAGFFPVAITDGVLVGTVSGSSNSEGVLELVDAATGRVRKKLGIAQELAAADGVLVWTTGCEVDSPAACQAHRQAISGGAVSTYRLPHSPGFSVTSLSPDGRMLAFTMQRAGQDPRFAVEHPFPPSDVAVLHLDTGAVDTVPGIEVPPKAGPSLAFTGDDWLVIGLAAGTRTRVLAWRPGLAHPIETRSVPGFVSAPPGLLLVHPAVREPGRQRDGRRPASVRADRCRPRALRRLERRTQPGDRSSRRELTATRSVRLRVACGLSTR